MIDLSFTIYFIHNLYFIIMTTLCFDFGNTRLKCAVFENSELKELVVINDDLAATILQLIEQYHPQKSILSSVINHDPEIENILQAHTKFHKLNEKSKLPVTTPVSKPETIGADRWALAAAAVTIFPGHHNLVIALGSCITYNFVNKFHEFLGGVFPLAWKCVLGPCMNLQQSFL